MQTIRAFPGEYGYDVVTDQGLLGRLGEEIARRLPVRRLLLVTDGQVEEKLGGQFEASLAACGLLTDKILLPRGAQKQTLSVLREVGARLEALNPDERDGVVAVGGGALLDIAGFAAAQYASPICLIQSPTSLIGMCDWAIGGRSALGHRPGARMVGSFVRPDLVLVDPCAAYTLPDREFENGLGEIVKCGFVMDASLFYLLECMTGRAEIEARIGELVARCQTLKLTAMSDANERYKLLAGHHLAHAIETAQRYRGLKHGEAVGVGLLTLARHTERLGITVPGTARRLEACLMARRLPVAVAAEGEGVGSILRTLGGGDVAVPERVGWSSVRQVGRDFFVEAWKGA